MIHVDLLKGEQKTEKHLKKSPMGLVPVLEMIENKQTKYLSESTAIIEWCEDSFLNNPLLPIDPYDRAQVRQLVQIINAGTQPLQNLATQVYYSEDTDQRKAWIQHWIHHGLKAYENLARQTAGKFSFGDHITMADLFLIPQLYNAIRFDVNLNDYPTICQIQENACKTEGYLKSHPDNYKPKQIQ